MHRQKSTGTDAIIRLRNRYVAAPVNARISPENGVVYRRGQTGPTGSWLRRADSGSRASSHQRKAERALITVIALSPPVPFPLLGK